MRKEGVVKKVLVGILGAWIILTGYKLARRGGAKSVRQASSPYYTMSPNKEERKQELGKATWTFLHHVAAKYPATPTREEQTNAIRLVDLITKMFPCTDCRKHFTQLVDSFPPKVSTQEEFSGWLCRAHNIVNARLGKPEFDCSRLDERWDCGCK